MTGPQAEGALIAGMALVTCWAIGAGSRDRAVCLWWKSHRWVMPPTARWDLVRGVFLLVLVIFAAVHDAVTLRRGEHWIGSKREPRS